MLLTLGALALIAGQLVPAGDLPYPSFWHEWVTAVGMLVFFIELQLRRHRAGQRVRVPAIAWCALALAVTAALQWLAGQLTFVADMLLPSTYLLGFGALAAAAATVESRDRVAVVNALMIAWVVSGVVSSAIALLQWVGVVSSHGWLSPDLPASGGRPAAQLGQPNMLCLMLTFGIAGALRAFEMRQLGRLACVALVVIMSLGLVVTQSRVALLCAVGLVGYSLIVRSRVKLRTDLRAMSAWAVCIVALLIALPLINALLGTAGVPLDDRASAGRRPQAWLLFADAALASPAHGWGWLQNGRAQLAVAADHPSLGYYFSSAHSLPLDLAVWIGVPAAVIALVAIGAITVRSLLSARNGAEWATGLPVVFASIHALVELPLHYGYVLWPIALLMGARAPRVQSVGASTPALGRSGLLTLALVTGFASLTMLIAADYRAVQAVRPTLVATEAFGPRELHSTSAAPEVVFLDHLRAFHALAADDLVGSTVARADAGSKVVERFPYPHAIERLAALRVESGDAEEAVKTLALVCKFATKAGCLEVKALWDRRRSADHMYPAWPPD